MRKEFGLTLKLLAVAKEENGEIQARVHPTFVPNSHPLANVNDAFNAVFIKGHACGEMMFYGRGAGDLPTASALVSDLICAAKAKRHELPAVSEAPCRMAEDWDCVYFVRMRAKDEPGVLSLITGGFAAEDVSIASMVQKGERDEAGFVQLIFPDASGERACRAPRACEDGFRAGKRRKHDPRREIKSINRKISITLCDRMAFFMEKCESFEEDCENINMCKVHKNGSKPTYKEKQMKCANLKKKKRIAGSQRNGRIKYVEKVRNRNKTGKMWKERRKNEEKRFRTNRRGQSADNVAGMTKTYKKTG